MRFENSDSKMLRYYIMSDKQIVQKSAEMEVDSILLKVLLFGCVKYSPSVKGTSDKNSKSKILKSVMDLVFAKELLSAVNVFNSVRSDK